MIFNRYILFFLPLFYPLSLLVMDMLWSLERPLNATFFHPLVGIGLLFFMLAKERKGAVWFLLLVVFLTNFMLLHLPFLLSLGLALGSSLGPWASYSLFKPLLQRNIFLRVHHTTTYLTALMSGATLCAFNGTVWFALFGFVDSELFPTSFIGWLAGDFISMLLFSSAYLFWRNSPSSWLKKTLKPTFFINTFAVFMMSYYLLTSSLFLHVEFFILIPLLIVLILYRERAIFINGFVVLGVGMYLILCPKGLCNTESAVSFTLLQLQTFLFFVFSAGYILAAALNQGETLLKEQEQINEETLITFAQFIEEKDAYTAGHSGRVAEYSRAIAAQMGLPKEEQELVYRAGLVHDIGKIITPESVLLKPGNLNETEYALMKQHADVGSQMIGKIQSFQPLAKIVRHHHEWYDGTGYPDGLKEEAIPLLSRIMIVADAFDAMTTNRIYKPKKTIQAAVAEIELMKGTQFDPVVASYAVDFFNTLTHINAYEQNIANFSSNAEAERFAYFFKDALTRLYNAIYFDILMHHKSDTQQYHSLHIVFIKGMNDYNHRFGWSKGDELLQDFAQFLENTFPNALLFRVYGDDFIILHQDHTTITPSLFETFEPVEKGEIRFVLKHLNLETKTISGAHELERLLFQGV